MYNLPIMFFLKNLSPKTCRLKHCKGFTIMELLVVIGIISIVTGIIMASISDSKAKGRDSKRIADIGVIQLALEKYYDEYHYYPALLTDSRLTTIGPIPKDPSTNLDYLYSPLNSNNTIPCSPATNCQSYHLGTTLDLNNGVLDDDTIDVDSIAGFDGRGRVFDVFPKF